MYVYYIGLPLLLLAAVIDASVLVQVRYLNGQPSLLLLLIVSWGLLNELPDSLPWAVMGGIFADLLSVAPLGASSLGFVLALAAVNSLFGRITRRNLGVPLVAVVVATVVYQAVVLVLLLFSGWSASPLGALLRWVLPTVVFNFLGILVVFRSLALVVEFFRPPSVPYF